MRHGQDNEDFVGGWSDVELIKEGIEQVYNSALWIKKELKIKKIICSDIRRAVQSAEIVSEVLNIPYEKNSCLREQNKGCMNGILKEDAYKKYPGFKDKEITVSTIFPDGESLRDLYNRMKDYLGELLQMDDDTLLITHRGVINMIYFILNGKDVDMDKKQFGVTVASIHALDKEKKLIKKIR